MNRTATLALLLTSLALLLVVLLAATASAEMIVNKYTNDFAVSSPYSLDVKACSCENRADPITITNTGQFPSTYSMQVDSDQSSWYQLSKTELTLNPGESDTFMVYAQPGCEATGSYSYSVVIASSYGRQRVLTRNLDVSKCQNVYLTVTGGANETNLCTPITYHLDLKNVAEFADTYHLDLGSFNDYANYTGGGADTFLEPDQEKLMNVTITPPCSLYGDVTIPFTVSSAKNQVTEQRTESVAIRNQFDHEIVASTKLEVCSRLPTQEQVGVKNLIDVPNTFDVMLNGPSFVNYDPKQLSIGGDGQKNVTLTIFPKSGDEGTYNLKIAVDSQLGDIRKTRDVQLDVVDCYAYTAGFVDQPQAADGSYTDTACCGDKAYTLNVRNAGSTEETYNILVDGPAWFVPEETTIDLKPSENRNVKIDAQLPCTDSSYEIPVTVVLNSHKSINESVVFKVDSETQQTCHAVALETQKVAIDEEATTVPLIVKSTGIEGGVYDVALSGELYNGTLEQSFTMAPGEEKVLHLSTKANLTDYFDGRYLGGVTLTYRELNLTYNGPFWTQFSHLSWLTTAWRAIAHYDYGSLPPCLWASIALLIVALAAIVLLVLALLGKGARRRTETFSELTLNVTRGVLVLLLIVALLAVALTPLPEKATLYQQPVNDTSGLVLQWYENQQFHVDLGRYFSDPDMDSLTFVATQPAHIAVDITGHEATLTPDHNWAGNDRIVFTASDGRGGVTDSPFLGLVVLQRKDLTFLQWLDRYCAQVNLWLLVVALVALLLIAFLRLTPRKRAPLPYGEVIEPPRKPGRKAARRTALRGGVVRTVVTKDGAVRRLGEPAKRRAVKAKSVRKKARGRKAARKPVRKAATRALIPAPKPGAVYTYQDAQGRTRTLGVAERIAWPEPAKAASVDKGATVNIAVGTHGAAAVAEPKEIVLVGAKNGNKIHNPQCIIAQRIPRKSKVVFTSMAAASKAGYGPCKVCQAFDKA